MVVCSYCGGNHADDECSYVPTPPEDVELVPVEDEEEEEDLEVHQEAAQRARMEELEESEAPQSEEGDNERPHSSEANAFHPVASGPREAPKKGGITSTYVQRKLPKGANQADYFNRISRIVGKVVSSKGLPKADRWGTADPFCVVKGIRSNLMLEQLSTTKVVINSLTPVWNHAYEFTVPDTWGFTELIGLKFLVFDSDTGEYGASELGSDDFMGGSDLDIADLHPGRINEFELDLGGFNVIKQKSQMMKKIRRPRITVQITTFREWLPRPRSLADQLMVSLHSFKRVGELYVKVVKARNVKPRSDKNMRLRDLQVVVRAICTGRDSAGEVLEIHKSRISRGCLENAIFDEDVRVPFEYGTEPMFLVLELWDRKAPEGAGGYKPRGHDDDHSSRAGSKQKEEEDEHLGSSMVPFFGMEWEKQLQNVRLGESLLEAKLNKEGRPPRNKRRVAAISRVQTCLTEPEEENQSRRRFEERLKRLQNLAGTAATHAREGLDLLRTFASDIGTVGPKATSLDIEVAVRWEEEPMPHGALLDRPFHVKNEDDATKAYNEWQQSRSSFTAPPMILEKRVRHAQVLQPDSHLVFVGGFIRGATDLVQADLLGKSDPYCIVEACSKQEELMFLHRTKVVQDSLCPSWEEHFQLALPEDFALARLIFSVYDSDAQSSSFAAAFDDGDDFLGRAAVDVSYLRNGEIIAGEVILIGARKNKTGSGFRRNSFLSLEITAERRISPVLVPLEDSHLPPLSRHKTSRIPPSKRQYYDPCQAIILSTESNRPAIDAMDLWRNNKLYDLHLNRGAVRLEDNLWLRNRPEGHRAPALKEGEELGDEDVEVIEVKPLAAEEAEAEANVEKLPLPPAKDMYDLTDLCPPRRGLVPYPRKSNSVPAIFTRFGQTSFAARTFARGGLMECSRSLEDGPMSQAHTINWSKPTKADKRAVLRMSDMPALKMMDQHPRDLRPER